MKSILSPLIAFLVFTQTSSADYTPLTFADLAGTSDKIVVGTITMVGQKAFALQVEDLIVGPGKEGETIAVGRFRDWGCAWRWSAYDVGQKVFVYLAGDKDTKVWRIRGAGGEGESPVVNEFVYANFFSNGKEVKFGKDRFGYPHSFVEFSCDQLRTAILEFRETYRVTPAAHLFLKNGVYVYKPIERIERIAKPSASPFPPRRPKKRFAYRSPIHRQLEESLDWERDRLKKHWCSTCNRKLNRGFPPSILLDLLGEASSQGE